jgi:N-glycosylase/DNA lyase
MIREADYEEARERVIAFPGIGPKVADCVLLYGFHKLEAFPVDVWIHRVMKKLYFPKRPVSEDKIRAYAKKKWGNLAGYVQQYLFHGARSGVI